MKGAKIKGQEERMAEKERQLGIERQRSDMNSRYPEPHRGRFILRNANLSLRAHRTVKDLEVQVAHLEQKRRLMKDLGDELEKHATMLFDREEQIERAEAATAQLKVKCYRSKHDARLECSVCLCTCRVSKKR